MVRSQRLASGIAAGLIAVASLAGCSNGTDKAASDATDGKPKVESSNGGVTVKTSEAAVAVGSAARLPDAWPKDIPTPPNSTLITSGHRGTSMTVMWRIEDNSSAIGTDYLASLIANGYTKKSTGERPIGIFWALTKGSRNVMLLALSAKGTTALSVTVADD